MGRGRRLGTAALQLVASSLAFAVGIFLGGWVRDRVVGGGGGTGAAGGSGGGGGGGSRMPLHLHGGQPGERGGGPRGPSSLKAPRHVAVVTTAALPWRTGTSINPMLRAAHLAHDAPRHKVRLVVPWLPLDQQPLVYPAGLTFETRAQQAEYILSEARQRTGLPCDFAVAFYEGRYFPSFGSVFPVEDVARVVPAAERDVAILEEPEHLNWFQHSTRWSAAFAHVVGIMHTNYLAYVKDGQTTGFLNAAAVYRVNRWVCRVHCHKVIKLSDAVQKLPHQATCNVHGVAGAFLDIGRAKRAAAPAPPAPPPAAAAAAAAAQGGDGGGATTTITTNATTTQQQPQPQPQQPQHRFTKGAYFVGKAVWGKGYRELISLGCSYETMRPEPFALDVVGAGEDLEAIKRAAADKGLRWRFLGAKDHADPSMHDYQVFINPSTSDVVATTTAEALAMGKWAVVPDIACNAFFKQFTNCLTYADAPGFAAAVDRALTYEPAPMGDAELKKLSWEAATERLLEVGSIAASEWPSAAEARYTAALWRMWRSLMGFSALREALGMTSASGADEPLVSESEDEEEEKEEAAAAAEQQQHARHQQHKRHARAARAQAALDHARSLAEADARQDWDLDWDMAGPAAAPA